jgi:hypothetical protein
MSETKYVKRYAVGLIESERGWGQKLDSTRYFDTLAEATSFMNEFNSQNDSPAVPDWYMYAQLPKEVFVELEKANDN